MVVFYVILCGLLGCPQRDYLSRPFKTMKYILIVICINTARKSEREKGREP